MSTVSLYFRFLSPWNFPDPFVVYISPELPRPLCCLYLPGTSPTPLLLHLLGILAIFKFAFTCERLKDYIPFLLVSLFIVMLKTLGTC